MRFVLIVLAAAVVAVAGLFIYGKMAQPETRLIEQEALNAGGA